MLIGWSFSLNVFSRSFQIYSLTNHASITFHMIKCHWDWLQPDEEIFCISLDANMFDFVGNVCIDLTPMLLTNLMANGPVLELTCQAVSHYVLPYSMWHDYKALPTAALYHAAGMWVFQKYWMICTTLSFALYKKIKTTDFFELFESLDLNQTTLMNNIGSVK